MTKVKGSIFNFRFPYGKYKGFLLSEINTIDRQYLIWVSKNFNNNIGERVKEFLNEKEKLNEQLNLIIDDCKSCIHNNRACQNVKYCIGYEKDVWEGEIEKYF